MKKYGKYLLCLLIGASIVLYFTITKNDRLADAPTGTFAVVFLPLLETPEGKFYQLSETSRLPVAALNYGNPWGKRPDGMRDQGQPGVYAEFICKRGWLGKYWQFQRTSSVCKPTL